LKFLTFLFRLHGNLVYQVRICTRCGVHVFTLSLLFSLIFSLEVVSFRLPHPRGYGCEYGAISRTHKHWFSKPASLAEEKAIEQQCLRARNALLLQVIKAKKDLDKSLSKYALRVKKGRGFILVPYKVTKYTVNLKRLEFSTLCVLLYVAEQSRAAVQGDTKARFLS